MKTVLLVMLTVSAATDAAAADGLIRLEFHELSRTGGESLEIRMVETERDASTSLVKIEVVSGTPDRSDRTMYLLKTACAITEARGERAFRAESFTTGVARVRLTFRRDSPMDDRDTVTVAQCHRAGF